MDFGHGPEHRREVRGPEAGVLLVEPDGQGELGRMIGGLLHLEVTLFLDQVVEQGAEQKGLGINDWRFTIYERRRDA